MYTIKIRVTYTEHGKLLSRNIAEYSCDSYNIYGDTIIMNVLGIESKVSIPIASWSNDRQWINLSIYDNKGTLIENYHFKPEDSPLNITYAAIGSKLAKEILNLEYMEYIELLKILYESENILAVIESLINDVVAYSELRGQIKEWK